MATLKDIRARIGSVKNVQKITRAMEMVAAARLRRAEQRIEHLRPYADAIRRMARRAPGPRRAGELDGEGASVLWYASGRRGVSSLEFRGRELAQGFTGFTDRPAYSDAREIADALTSAYVDE